MRFRGRRRYVGAGIGLVLTALLAASWGGWGDNAQAKYAGSGPVIALYVVDHQGAQPDAETIAPYEEAFDRITAGCTVDPGDLASQIFALSDQASMGSGVEFDNLAVLRAIAREVGETPVDCTNTFMVAEARLEGSALG